MQFIIGAVVALAAICLFFQSFPWVAAFLVVAIVFIILYCIINANKQNTESTTTRAGYVEDYSFYTKVVGVTFNGIQSVLPTLRRGMRLTLVREPDNQYDRNAVAVKCNGRRIGHLDARTAMDIARVMDNCIPVDGVIKEITGGGSLNYGCNIKVIVYKKANPENQFSNKAVRVDMKNPFNGKLCVIFGVFDKSTVQYQLEKLGATVKNKVTEETAFVITTYPDWLNSRTVNADRAKELIEKGQDIKIIKLDEFNNMVDKYMK